MCFTPIVETIESRENRDETVRLKQISALTSVAAVSNVKARCPTIDLDRIDRVAQLATDCRAECPAVQVPYVDCAGQSMFVVPCTARRAVAFDRRMSYGFIIHIDQIVIRVPYRTVYIAP